MEFVDFTNNLERFDLLFLILCFLNLNCSILVLLVITSVKEKVITVVGWPQPEDSCSVSTEYYSVLSALALAALKSINAVIVSRSRTFSFYDSG